MVSRGPGERIVELGSETRIAAAGLEKNGLTRRVAG